MLSGSFPVLLSSWLTRRPARLRSNRARGQKFMRVLPNARAISAARACSQLFESVLRSKEIALLQQLTFIIPTQ
jgi:hypothetical protein